MKNRIFQLYVLLLSCFLYAETQRIIELQNAFGGETHEILYEAGDNNFGILESSRLYYDLNGTLIKSISRLSIGKNQETGFVFQEQEYKNNKIMAYKMYLSESEKLIRGYDYLIEIMGDSDNVVSCGYGYGDKLVKENTDSFAYNYPFINLNCLFDLIYEDYQPNKNGDEVTISGQYNKGRSLVTFLSDIKPMTTRDKEIAGHFFETFQSDGLQVYNSKIIISENGKEYELYLQDNLKQFIKKNSKALISFIVLGFNHTLHPLITSLIEVD